MKKDSVYVYARFNGDLSQLNDPRFYAVTRQMFMDHETMNIARRDDLMKKRSTLLVLAAEIYGRDSAVFKYLNCQDVPKPLSSVDMWKKLQKQFKVWQEKEERRAREASRRAARNSRISDAAQTLERMGYTPGVDFTRQTAIKKLGEVLTDVDTEID